MEGTVWQEGWRRDRGHSDLIGHFWCCILSILKYAYVKRIKGRGSEAEMERKQRDFCCCLSLYFPNYCHFLCHPKLFYFTVGFPFVYFFLREAEIPDKRNVFDHIQACNSSTLNEISKTESLTDAAN